MARPADADQALEHAAGLVRRLQRLAQDDIIEGICGIVLQVVIGIALDDGEAMPHAGVDPRLAQPPCRGRRRSCVAPGTPATRRRRSRHRGRGRPCLDHAGDEPEIATEARRR